MMIIAIPPWLPRLTSRREPMAPSPEPKPDPHGVGRMSPGNFAREAADRISNLEHRIEVLEGEIMRLTRRPTTP
ncbi:hypothetical protein KLEP181_gp09 [Paracoccus phage vB_PmaP_KLEP18-1]|nr:hypothetical protein KLEP181_gp09 [Paracoccus phage vB_PmaP_KLEP18-1]